MATTLTISPLANAVPAVPLSLRPALFCLTPLQVCPELFSQPRSATACAAIINIRVSRHVLSCKNHTRNQFLIPGLTLKWLRPSVGSSGHLIAPSFGSVEPSGKVISRSRLSSASLDLLRWSSRGLSLSRINCCTSARAGGGARNAAKSASGAAATAASVRTFCDPRKREQSPKE